MAEMSDYLEEQVLDYVLRGTAFTSVPDGSVYVSLHTADPLDAGSGSDSDLGLGELHSSSSFQNSSGLSAPQSSSESSFVSSVVSSTNSSIILLMTPKSGRPVKTRVIRMFSKEPLSPMFVKCPEM